MIVFISDAKYNEDDCVHFLQLKILVVLACLLVIEMNSTAVSLRSV